MRIGIVNDLRLAREALRRAVASAPRHSLAWTAADGAEAVERTREDRPDIILMDLIMPVLDGVEATRRIMAETPCLVLVVTSSVGGNIGKVYEALGHGAVDAVDTPRLGPDGRVEGAEPLLKKIDVLEKLAKGPPPGLVAPESSASFRPVSARADVPPLVGIGASTGGPNALARILADLPAGLPAGVVIVQHVDAAFAPGLVRWLGGFSRLPVGPIVAGDRPAPGRVLVAQTDDHVVLSRDGTLNYSPEPREACYRPSVDVFFQSLARNAGTPGVAVLLTGMGRDGAQGMAALRRIGWHTIAQDEASSSIWGMPRAAIAAGCVAEVLPPGRIAAAIVGGLPAQARA